MAWQAKHRFARISARKARLVVDMVRGRDVQDALNVLKFSPHRAAVMVSRGDFRSLVSDGTVELSTSVFDTTLTRVSLFREGGLEQPAERAWHGKAFF